MATKPEWLEGLRNIGLFAIVALTMILIGTSDGWAWALIPVTPLLAVLFAWLVTKSWKAVWGWGALGLVAGIGFYIAAVA